MHELALLMATATAADVAVPTWILGNVVDEVPLIVGAAPVKKTVLDPPVKVPPLLAHAVAPVPATVMLPAKVVVPEEILKLPKVMAAFGVIEPVPVKTSVLVAAKV